MNTKTKLIVLILGIITLPLSLYLDFLLLKKIEATELMWFLFWILILTTATLIILLKIAEREK